MTKKQKPNDLPCIATAAKHFGQGQGWSHGLVAKGPR